MPNVSSSPGPLDPLPADRLPAGGSFGPTPADAPKPIPTQVDRPPVAVPVTAVSEDERAWVMERLRNACSEGRLTLDEYSNRTEMALSATSRAELERTHADLSNEAPVVGQRQNSDARITNIFGDTKRLGRWRIPDRLHVLNVFGDITLDLRDALTNADEIYIDVRCLFGDVKIIVPEGVEAELSATPIFGDKKLDLAPVPRVPGTPLILVNAKVAFGDLKVFSLGPGEATSAWRRFIDRLAGS